MYLEISGVGTRLLLDTVAKASVLNLDALRKLLFRVNDISLAIRLLHFSEKLISNFGTNLVPVLDSGERLKNIKFFIVRQGA